MGLGGVEAESRVQSPELRVACGFDALGLNAC